MSACVSDCARKMDCFCESQERLKKLRTGAIVVVALAVLFGVIGTIGALAAGGFHYTADKANWGTYLAIFSLLFGIGGVVGGVLAHSEIRTERRRSFRPGEYEMVGSPGEEGVD